MSAYVEIDTGKRQSVFGPSGDVKQAADQK